MKTIRLKRGVWKYDPSQPLGPEGGFGAVFLGADENGEQVAVKRLKLTAQDAAHRELRIADELAGKDYSYVMPILDAGQDADSDRYFIVMPRAERSLQDLIDDEGLLDEKRAASILLEIAKGLEEIPDLVHRDLKPGNVLLHEGHWKVADFGIARFVEESTSRRTLKKFLYPPYGAPEQWRFEHATAATDVYALGCVAYTLLTGNPPFNGPSIADLQHQHLNENPPPITGINPRLKSLLSMMLRKSPNTRPSIQRVKSLLISFLEDNRDSAAGGGWDALARAGAEVAEKEGQEEAKKQQEMSERQRRNSLATAALRILADITNELFRRITDSAPSAKRTRSNIVLGRASLEIAEMNANPIDKGAFPRSGWDVVAGAIIGVEQSNQPYVWSASLWYFKQHENDEYRWREVSYFYNVFASERPRYEPYFLDKPNAADEAAGPGRATHQIAWGPAPIDDEDAESFYKRWADLFARAARGQLSRPSRFPLQ